MRKQKKYWTDESYLTRFFFSCEKMPSIFPLQTLFSAPPLCAFFRVRFFQADGSTLNTTQALKWELPCFTCCWMGTVVTDRAWTHGTGRSKGWQPLCLQWKFRWGTLDQTWRVLAYMVLLYNGLSRFPSLLNGFLVVAPVLETCQDDMNVVQKIDPLRRWLHDLNDQICDPFGILWYHKPWAASMSYPMITKAWKTQLSFLFFRSLGGCIATCAGRNVGGVGAICCKKEWSFRVSF